MCELDGFIYAAGRGSLRKPRWLPRRHRSRPGPKRQASNAQQSLAKFCGTILSDECHPVVSRCALIHDGVPFVWDVSPRRSVGQPQTRCDAEKGIHELSQDRSSSLHRVEGHSAGTNISEGSSDRSLRWLQIPKPQALQDAATDCSLEYPIRIRRHIERFVSASLLACRVPHG